MPTSVKPSMTLPLRTSSTKTSVFAQYQGRLKVIKTDVNPAFQELEVVWVKLVQMIMMITSTRSLCTNSVTPERGSRETTRVR